MRARFVTAALWSLVGAVQHLTELSAADLQEIWSGNQLVDFVQIYASGPQMTAFLIEELDAENTLYFGKTLVPSLLHTVPI